MDEALAEHGGKLNIVAEVGAVQTDPTVSNDLYLALPRSRPISRLTLETCRIVRGLSFA